MDPVKATNEVLDIMGYLFINGADPTVKSKNKTPRDIVTKHGFKLGAALLGNKFESYDTFNFYICRGI